MKTDEPPHALIPFLPSSISRPMHTIIHRHQHQRFPAAKPATEFRSPHYECLDLPQSLKLAIYVPGVDAHGIEVTTQGADLVITARKAQHVRANWQALHLETAQRDYQLTLRLGTGYDFDSLRATLSKGVLTIVLPKRRPALADPPARQRQVA